MTALMMGTEVIAEMLVIFNQLIADSPRRLYSRQNMPTTEVKQHSVKTVLCV
jgi:hypothetical protein